MSRIRLNIGLEKSLTPGATIVTDLNSEATYLSPGAMGAVLTINASGLPVWDATRLAAIEAKNTQQDIDIAGKAATNHTHPLVDILQSGATTDQVPAWNGSAWQPKSVSSIISGNFIQNQIAAPQNPGNFWIQGTGKITSHQQPTMEWTQTGGVGYGVYIPFHTTGVNVGYFSLGDSGREENLFTVSVPVDGAKPGSGGNFQVDKGVISNAGWSAQGTSMIQFDYAAGTWMGRTGPTTAFGVGPKSFFIYDQEFQKYRMAIKSTGNIILGGSTIASDNGAAVQITDGVLSLTPNTTDYPQINGGLFYRSDTNKFRGGVNGQWVDLATSADLATIGGNFIQNQNAAAQVAANFWIDGSARINTSLTAALGSTNYGNFRTGFDNQIGGLTNFGKQAGPYSQGNNLPIVSINVKGTGNPYAFAVIESDPGIVGQLSAIRSVIYPDGSAMFSNNLIGGRIDYFNPGPNPYNGLLYETDPLTSDLFIKSLTTKKIILNGDSVASPGDLVQVGGWSNSGLTGTEKFHVVGKSSFYDTLKLANTTSDLTVSNGALEYRSDTQQVRAGIGGAWKTLLTADLVRQGTRIIVDRYHPNATDTRTGINTYSEVIPFLTIGAAIAAAGNGDTIEIRGYVVPGGNVYYNESLVITSRHVTLILRPGARIASGATAAINAAGSAQVNIIMDWYTSIENEGSTEPCIYRSQGNSGIAVFGPMSIPHFPIQSADLPWHYATPRISSQNGIAVNGLSYSGYGGSNCTGVLVWSQNGPGAAFNCDGFTGCIIRADNGYGTVNCALNHCKIYSKLDCVTNIGSISANVEDCDLYSTHGHGFYTENNMSPGLLCSIVRTRINAALYGIMILTNNTQDFNMEIYDCHVTTRDIAASEAIYLRHNGPSGVVMLNNVVVNKTPILPPVVEVHNLSVVNDPTGKFPKTA